MGRKSRTKGVRFERKIANEFRERWPDAEVRRASQADRAHQSDVYVQGGPEVLSRLWIECNDARSPDPVAKLKQAEFDIAMRNSEGIRLPVVVWHQTGARTTYVTTRLWVFDWVRGRLISPSHLVATMELGQFLVMTAIGAQEAA